MDKRKIIIVAIGIFILGGSVVLSVVLSGMKQNEEKEKLVIPVKAVRTETVKYNDVETSITGFGRVLAAESIQIIAEKSGKIQRNGARLKEGKSFKEGEFLFRIDDTEAQLNLLSQKSNFLRDLASILPDMKIDFPDSYEQWKNYFNSIELDKDIPKIPNYNSEKEKTFLATKNIFSGYYNIKSTEASLEKHNVYAPFRGTITEVFQQEGSFVNPGSPVVNFIRTDKKELRIAVDVEEIKWIKRGSEVRIIDESSSKEWPGIVSRIGEYVNQNTQSLDVFVEIGAGTGVLYDGQYLKAVLAGARIENASIIPREAVFDRNKVYVFKDSVLKVRNIQVEKSDENTIVYRGLNEGEEVVVEALLNAYNNMKVRRLEEDDTEKKVEVNTVSQKNS